MLKGCTFVIKEGWKLHLCYLLFAIYGARAVHMYVFRWRLLQASLTTPPPSSTNEQWPSDDVYIICVEVITCSLPSYAIAC